MAGRRPPNPSPPISSSSPISADVALLPSPCPPHLHLVRSSGDTTTGSLHGRRCQRRGDGQRSCGCRSKGGGAHRSSLHADLRAAHHTAKEEEAHTTRLKARAKVAACEIRDALEPPSRRKVAWMSSGDACFYSKEEAKISIVVSSAFQVDVGSTTTSSTTGTRALSRATSPRLGSSVAPWSGLWSPFSSSAMVQRPGPRVRHEVVKSLRSPAQLAPT